MRFLSPKAHGALDYIMGPLIALSPWLFDFAAGGAETWIPVIVGAGALIYNLFSDHDFAIRRLIPMRTHLTLDMIGGALLAVSPWLFGFSDRVSTPHLVLGLLEIGSALVTQRTPVERDVTGRAARSDVPRI